VRPSASPMLQKSAVDVSNGARRRPKPPLSPSKDVHDVADNVRINERALVISLEIPAADGPLPVVLVAFGRLSGKRAKESVSRAALYPSRSSRMLTKRNLITTTGSSLQ
jgi:hypothetical protein